MSLVCPRYTFILKVKYLPMSEACSEPNSKILPKLKIKKKIKIFSMNLTL